MHLPMHEFRIICILEAEEKAKLHSLKIQNLELQTTKWFIESCV